MPYQANVVKVFIASPGDVAEERAVIREVLHEWNVLHSESQKMVALPIGWESHASPVTGGHPQSIINREVLEGCDLLVAVFWTRIGTPTETDVSGTVEEIKRHIDCGKPAMIYFSSAPCPPGNLDSVQYEAVKTFKIWCQSKSVFWPYDSVSRFKEDFRKHLEQRIQRNFSDLKVDTLSKPIETPLSEDGFKLISKAVESNATIFASSSRAAILRIDSHSYGNPRDMKDAARWKEALREIVDRGLVEDPNGNRTAYNLTAQGIRVVEDMQRTTKSDGL